MFSPKLRHFSSFAAREISVRFVCCHSNVSILSRSLLTRVKSPRELRSCVAVQHSPLSSASVFCQPAACTSCRTLTCSQNKTHFHTLGTANRQCLPSRQTTMAEAQRQLFRAKHQKRQNRLVARDEERKLDRNGKLAVQVIGTGSKDCPPSILVIADSKRFLFNCGEGTQRLMFENRLRSLAKLEHIFFTRMTWDNVGGSIGMMITLKNVGLPKLSLYGPPELAEFSKALQIFAKQETIDLDVNPYSKGPFFNEVMMVTPVPLIQAVSPEPGETGPVSPSRKQDKSPTTSDAESDSDRGSKEEAESDVSEGEATTSEGKKRKAADPFDVISQMAVKQRSAPGPKRRKTANTPDVSIAYICKLHDTHGRLDVQKVKDLGLKPGPEYGLLKAGKVVTAPNGKEIKPEDVLQPPTPGAVFIILECPSEKFVDSVVNSESFLRYQIDAGDNTPSLVLHICPEDVISDTRYHSWLQRFGPTTQHVVFNQSCRTVNHEGSRRLQAKLNLINGDVFPLLPVHRNGAVRDEHPPNDDIMARTTIHKADSFLRYHLRPHTGFDREFVQSPSNEPFIQEALAVPGFKQSLEELGNQLTEHRQQRSMETRAQYPEVVFFGTGSAMPNKERNVTGILLNLSKTQSMIMDCGEGTFNQLCRFYGDHTDAILANLQSVFVSHMHADHHVGLIQILQQWKRVMLERGETSKNLIVVGPKRLLIWLNNYNSYCESFIHQMRFIELGDLSRKSDERSRHEESLLARLMLTEYETVPVPHCHNSHGLVIKHREGWKLVYSGDAMPSDDLIQAGKDADVLIHEATLENGMEAEAQKKRHSMISQAIDVGQKMGAKFTILTHFSQRYPKIPLFDEQLSHSVGVAFDNMRVSLSELDQLPVCLPALQHLFTNYIQEMQDNRERKAEKEAVISLDSALKSGKVACPADAGPAKHGDGASEEGQASA